MDKYIKININNEVIDIFFTYQKLKFDGTEILIEENVSAPFKHLINGQSISNEYGIFLFKYISGSIVEKTPSEIDADLLNYLPTYLEQKILQARQLLYTSWPDSSQTVAALKAQYDNFKNGSYANISEVDAAYNNFVSFMDLS